MREDMPTTDELEKTLLFLMSKSKKLLNNDEMLVAVSNYLFYLRSCTKFEEGMDEGSLSTEWLGLELMLRRRA